MRQFYPAFPIRHALRSELSWTHYRRLMRIPDAEARAWHMNECAKSGWSTRQPLGRSDKGHETGRPRFTETCTGNAE